MAKQLPPPPVSAEPGDWEWLDWYRQVADFVGGEAGAISWSSIDTSGSNITDIATRAHNDLQSNQGGASGEYYHLTQEEHTSISGYQTYTSADSPVTLTANSTGNILANTASGTISITLPAASSVKEFFIKKIGGAANAVTITRAGSDTIQGSTSVSSSTDYASWTLRSDGVSTWYIKSTT